MEVKNDEGNFFAANELLTQNYSKQILLEYYLQGIFFETCFPVILADTKLTV